MSWNIHKPNVSLAIARFAPDVDRVPAGLTAEQRAEHQARRARECAKVEPAIPLDEQDLGPVESYDDHANWKDAYADSVGVSRWREL